MLFLISGNDYAILQHVAKPITRRRPLEVCSVYYGKKQGLKGFPPISGVK